MGKDNEHLIIKIFQAPNFSFGAEVFVNGEWIKEICGLPSKLEVIKALSTNEDFISIINES